MIFSAIIDKEKVNLFKIIGCLVGFGGIILIFFEKLTIGQLDLKSPILALASAIFYGLYTVLGRNISVKIGSLKMNSYSFIAGSLLLLPFLLFFKISVIKFDYSGIYQVIYLSFLVTGLAYLSYFKGLSVIGSSKGSLVFFIKPVLASLIAILFLGEGLTINLLLGTVLILIGIAIITRWPQFKVKIYRQLEGFSK
jgi:drug/metabolite transporter (DMT)-like permease